jgi:hypothetical protein
MMSRGRCRLAGPIGLWHFAALALGVSQSALTLLVRADEVIE